ncbi:MAG: universal stress protein [Gemmatimonadota bacterium]
MNARRRDRAPAALIVGVSNPATAERLVRLATVLAETGSWTLVLTHVVTVANQISLTTGRASPEVVRARDFLQAVLDGTEAAGGEMRAVVEVARSVDEGLLAAAESRRASMILVGYSEAEGEGGDAGLGEEEFDRIMHRVARKADADTVVAKFRKETLRRVLVPLAAEAPLQTTGLICRALSTLPGSELTFLHVAAPDADVRAARARLEARLAEAGLGSAEALEVRVGEDPVEVIAHQAGDFDVTIVGPSGRPGLMHSIFSSRAERIAEETPTSVLLVWS